MPNPLRNVDLVKSQAKETFKERLKMDIYEGAALLSLDEIESVVRAVCDETLSFLFTEAKPRSGKTDDSR